MIEILGWFVFLLGLLLLPFAILIPILVAVNVKELRTTLFSKCSRIPGFRSGTTWKSVLGVFFYISFAALILTMGGALMIGPSADNLEVSDTTINEDEIIAGDSIEVAGTVENTGNETETFTIELTADGTVLESEEVTLEPNETRRVDFQTSISDAGEYRIEFHDTVVGSVVVQDNIVIKEASMSDEAVAIGDSVSIFGTVANIGNSSDTATVNLLVDGEVADTTEVQLNPRGEQEIEFSQKFDEEGDYEIRINDVSVGMIVAREQNKPLDPETQVRCWIDENRDKIEKGQNEFEETARAFGDEDFSEVMYHSRLAFDEYEQLNASAHELSLEDKELERTLQDYYYHAYQASGAAYSAGYEIEVNDDPVAADAMIDRLERHSNEASDARSDLKSELDVDESTPLWEISVDSERC